VIGREKQGNTMSDVRSTFDPPVTVTVTRQVKPGCEKEFEELVTTLAKRANHFPGHLGANFFRPSGTDKEYHVIFKFDSMSHFHQWETSDTRNELYNKIGPLLSKPPRVSVLTGLETWFDLGKGASMIPPPRYKMAMVSWLAIYPLVILVLECLNPILQQLPIPARALLITFIVIPTMTYILMPRMARLFSKWLYPEKTENTP
jgi:antibiotic biosynthesis monooxygenase (ABM) superfamily enzyme